MLEEMAAFFERRLAGYEEHMMTAIAGAAEFYPFTAAQLPAKEGCAILDLGCGTGLELDAYFARNPSARILGVDVSQGMLSALKQKFPDKGLELVCGSYFDVPFGKERFDGAVSVESLHHFVAEEKLALYQKLWDSLKTNGYFVLTDYFAESEALEREYQENLQRMKSEQGLAGGLYHYDTPLTVDHEEQVLREAGFSRLERLKNWGATYTLKGVK